VNPAALRTVDEPGFALPRHFDLTERGDRLLPFTAPYPAPGDGVRDPEERVTLRRQHIPPQRVMTPEPTCRLPQAPAIVLVGRVIAFDHQTLRRGRGVPDDRVETPPAGLVGVHTDRVEVDQQPKVCDDLQDLLPALVAFGAEVQSLLPGQQ